jgi:hypothetical protein
MKIKKSQLRRLIKEELQRLDEIPTYRKMAAARAGVPHMGSSPLPPGHPSRLSPQTDEDPHGDEAEHDRGFIDGYYGELEAEDATADYYIGHEQGGKEYASDEERGLDRDPEDILRTQYV